MEGKQRRDFCHPDSHLTHLHCMLWKALPATNIPPPAPIQEAPSSLFRTISQWVGCPLLLLTAHLVPVRWQCHVHSGSTSLIGASSERLERQLDEDQRRLSICVFCVTYTLWQGNLSQLSMTWTRVAVWSWSGNMAQLWNTQVHVYTHTHNLFCFSCCFLVSAHFLCPVTFMHMNQPVGKPTGSYSQ